MSGVLGPNTPAKAWVELISIDELKEFLKPLCHRETTASGYAGILPHAPAEERIKAYAKREACLEKIRKFCNGEE